MSKLCLWFVYFTLDAVYKVKPVFKMYNLILWNNFLIKKKDKDKGSKKL